MKFRRALTLVEILTVLSIGTILMSITIPSVSKVRRQARSLKSMHNLRQIVLGVNIYATDNEGDYPASVATLSDDDGTWQWEDPRMMCACKTRNAKTHRSMSAYLKEYFPNADVLTCPSAPSRYEYLQDAWDAGDDWSYPGSSYDADSLYGSYDFFWGYRGYLTATETVFRGPSAQDRRHQSNILCTDYFGLKHIVEEDSSERDDYFSCEYIKPPGISLGSDVSSDCWTVQKSVRTVNHFAKVKLHKGSVDGSVSTYHPTETVPLEVSIASDGSVPYPSELGTGPGFFFIPQ